LFFAERQLNTAITLRSTGKARSLLGKESEIDRSTLANWVGGASNA
jgi:hypothetical protein